MRTVLARADGAGESKRIITGASPLRDAVRRGENSRGGRGVKRRDRNGE